MSVIEKVSFGNKALTEAEDLVFSRACAWVGPMLQRHGIGLTSREIRFVGAEVADYVLSEIAAANKKTAKEKTA